jgi:hypothetical protein
MSTNIKVVLVHKDVWTKNSTNRKKKTVEASLRLKLSNKRRGNQILNMLNRYEMGQNA